MVEPYHGIFTDHCARTHILHEGRAFTPWPGLGFFTTGLADLLLGTLRSNVSSFPHSSNHLSTFLVYPKGLYSVQLAFSVADSGSEMFEVSGYIILVLFGSESKNLHCSPSIQWVLKCILACIKAVQQPCCEYTGRYYKIFMMTYKKYDSAMCMEQMTYNKCT